MKNVSLFALSALLLCLSSPGPGLSICAWFALIPLMAGCLTLSPAGAARLGFGCGLVYYTFLLYWVVISLGTYGQLPGWLCGLALILLAAYMSLYLALFSAFLSWSSPILPPLWTAPLLWVALDFVRGFLFSGFPWQDLAYSQFGTPPVIQLADIAGHHGLTFVIVLANTLFLYLFLAMRGKFPWHGKRLMLELAAATVLLVAAAGYCLFRFGEITEMIEDPARPTVSVAVIQGNIDQGQKWLPERKIETVETYLDLSRDATNQGRTELVIWPETALPFHPENNPLFEDIITRSVLARGYSLLTGAPYIRAEAGDMALYNSAVLVKPDGTGDLYFKQHLVPFGEYIPFSDILPLPGPLVESVGNFSSGTSSAPLVGTNFSLGILICFESIFADLARKEVANGADLLVNLTNDAWFGRSSASLQHLAMAVFRAVENRRSLARAANSGISCFIDPAGRISEATPLFARCTIREDLVRLSTVTFFTRAGYLFPYICLFSLIPLLIWLKITNIYTDHRR